MSNSKLNAIVYCEGAFNTQNGKTAHGLVRYTERYEVLAVVDSLHSGQEAGTVLDGKDCGIPIVASLDEAIQLCSENRVRVSHFVIGLAPDGGRLSTAARDDVKLAIGLGLNVDSGLHDFVSEDSELSKLARKRGVVLTDVRKPPPRSELHFFTGDIEKVGALKIAVLGTDSAVGKRTTAWRLVDGFRKAGYQSEMVGTGQTAWMQGARYCVVADSLVSDFVAGEIEHAVYRAWSEQEPDVIVIEGQGSLMNPAYPGGFEILAAARPDVIVLQHAFQGIRSTPCQHKSRRSNWSRESESWPLPSTTKRFRQGNYRGCAARSSALSDCQSSTYLSTVPKRSSPR
jgi:uncharacterized NAD-dependent epimerase/dehydratase family protein